MRYKFNEERLQDLSYEEIEAFADAINIGFSMDYFHRTSEVFQIYFKFELLTYIDVYFYPDRIEIKDNDIDSWTEGADSAAFQKAIELGIYTPMEP